MVRQVAPSGYLQNTFFMPGSEIAMCVLPHFVALCPVYFCHYSIMYCFMQLDPSGTAKPGVQHCRYPAMVQNHSTLSGVNRQFARADNSSIPAHSLLV